MSRILRQLFGRARKFPLNLCLERKIAALANVEMCQYSATDMLYFRMCGSTDEVRTL